MQGERICISSIALRFPTIKSDIKFSSRDENEYEKREARDKRIDIIKFIEDEHGNKLVEGAILL